MRNSGEESTHAHSRTHKLKLELTRTHPLSLARCFLPLNVNCIHLYLYLSHSYCHSHSHSRTLIRSLYHAFVSTNNILIFVVRSLEWISFVSPLIRGMDFIFLKQQSFLQINSKILSIFSHFNTLHTQSREHAEVVPIHQQNVYARTISTSPVIWPYTHIGVLFIVPLKKWATFISFPLCCPLAPFSVEFGWLF